MNTMTIITNGLLMTLGDENRIIENGAVAFEGNLIKEIGTSEEIVRKYPMASHIDARGKVIMPGLVNCHMHLYSTYACGISSEPSANFVEVLEKLWWRLDEALLMDDVYYSALIPYIRCIKSGTTTVIDHHASPSAIKGSLDRLADASLSMGIRSSFCYEVTDRGGPEKARQGIDENVRFIERCRAEKDDMLAGMFGLHASMTLSAETLKHCAEAVEGLDCGFHVHVAEDRADEKDSIDKYGIPVVARYHELGMLGPKTIAVHCVHVNEEEMAMLADTQTVVVHNPQSNMNNAVGAADILTLLKKGITVALGTDGMTSNMYDEIRAGYMIQHHEKRDPRVAFCEVVDMLTKTNPKVASRQFRHKVGVLEPGAYADIILVDYFPFTPIGVNNFYGHFVFGLGASIVDTTIVNGRMLMKGKELLFHDEKFICRQASRLSPETWRRFQR